MWWRAVGLAGAVTLASASAIIATRTSQDFYGLDHPVNLLFYFHVSVAWVGFAGLAIAALLSAAYLRRPDPQRTWVAQAAVRVSFALLTLTLASGMVWGRFVWNSWWEWSDIRLVTALVVWFIYAGYLLYHQQARHAADLRRGAAFCLLAFVSVPVTVASTRLWQSPFHGTTMTSESAPVHLPALLLALAGMTAVYVYLVALRWHVHAVDDRTAAAERAAA